MIAIAFTILEIFAIRTIDTVFIRLRITGVASLELI